MAVYGHCFVSRARFPIRLGESLGPIATPLDWTARIVPSIEKAAAISPLGDLVRGYLAFLFLTSFLMILVVVWRDPLVERFKYAFTSGNAKLLPRILFIYGLGVPALLLVSGLFGACRENRNWVLRPREVKPYSA